MIVRKWPLLSVMLFFACATFPLYILPPGLPQPSHYIFAILSFATAITFRRFLFRKEEALLLCLFAWMAIRQAFYFLTGGIFIDSFVPVIFFGFNLALYGAVALYATARRDEAAKAAIGGVMCALLIAVILLLTSGFITTVQPGSAGVSRSVAGFNNPNQLGYFAIGCAGIIVFARLTNKLSGGGFILLSAVCVVIAVASLSKAAMIGIVFYGIAFLRSIKGAALILGVLLVFGIGLYYVGAKDFAAVDRLATIGQSSDDNLVSRGYGPLVDPDARFLFGWGEGYVTSQIGHETHSTLGNVLISYGFVGAAIFLGFLGLIFRRLVVGFGLLPALGLCLPYLLYGLTHNGFRFSVVWVMLAVFASVPVVSARRN